MARNITKTFGTAQTVATVAYIKDGQMVTETMQFDGRKSQKAAQVAIRKMLNTTNFFISSLETVESENEETYTLDSDVFAANAEECADGGTYGREYVTSTVKATIYGVLSANGMEQFILSGTPATSRARNAIADSVGSDNFLITEQRIVESRMYMTREKFVELATRVK